MNAGRKINFFKKSLVNNNPSLVKPSSVNNTISVNDSITCLANIDSGVFTYNCTIGSVTISSLFDTGASLNYISKSFAEILVRNNCTIKFEALVSDHSVR